HESLTLRKEHNSRANNRKKSDFNDAFKAEVSSPLPLNSTHRTSRKATSGCNGGQALCSNGSGGFGVSESELTSYSISSGLSLASSTANTSSNSTVSGILAGLARSDWEEKVTALVSLSNLALHQPCSLLMGYNANSNAAFLGQIGSSPSWQLGAQTSSSSSTVSGGGSGNQPIAVPFTMRQQSAKLLHQVMLAVTTECRNLRSQVSRQAVQTMAALFRGLGRGMDAHVDAGIRCLLSKAGEAGAAFIRGEVATAMDDVASAASPARLIAALIQHGLGYVMEGLGQPSSELSFISA
ncbi:unnamed protein product, partial [Protopolystoma xenopodis]